MYSNLSSLSLSLSQITGSFMAFNNNFDTLSYISESNDSYLLQSTRKIDIHSVATEG